MGEYYEPTDYRESASGVTEALAHYLYDHYEQNPEPSDEFMGGGQPWRSAGKRKREHWWTEAENLLAYAAGLFVEQVKR